MRQSICIRTLPRFPSSSFSSFSSFFIFFLLFPFVSLSFLFPFMGMPSVTNGRNRQQQQQQEDGGGGATSTRSGGKRKINQDGRHNKSQTLPHPTLERSIENQFASSIFSSPQIIQYFIHLEFQIQRSTAPRRHRGATVSTAQRQRIIQNADDVVFQTVQSLEHVSSSISSITAGDLRQATVAPPPLTPIQRKFVSLHPLGKKKKSQIGRMFVSLADIPSITLLINFFFFYINISKNLIKLPKKKRRRRKELMKWFRCDTAFKFGNASRLKASLPFPYRSSRAALLVRLMAARRRSDRPTSAGDVQISRLFPIPNPE